MITVSETYDIITHESAEHGDCAESGFNFQDREFGFKELVEYIQDNGFTETSSYPPGANDWITTGDDDIDYATGDRTRRSLHGDGSKYWTKALRACGLL